MARIGGDEDHRHAALAKRLGNLRTGKAIAQVEVDQCEVEGGFEMLGGSIDVGRDADAFVSEVLEYALELHCDEHFVFDDEDSFGHANL